MNSVSSVVYSVGDSRDCLSTNQFAPFFVVLRGEGAGGEGLGDEGAAGGDGGEGSGGDGLRHDVSQCGSFDGACEDGHAGGVGGHLVEKVVLAAAADDVQRSELSAGDFFEHSGDLCICDGEGFEDDAGELAVGGGDGLVGFRAMGGDFARHVAGG